MTDKAHENIKTGDKAERQEQLSPAKAGENQITKKADFSKAFHTAHAHDRTLSGTHDAAFEIMDGSSTLVSSRKQEKKPDSRSEAYLKTVKNPTADALYEMRKNIDKLPPGPQKDNALTEARKTQKEMFPASYEHTPDDNDGGTFKALTPDSPQPFTVGENSDGGILIKTGLETRHVAEPSASSRNPWQALLKLTPEQRQKFIESMSNAGGDIAKQSINETSDDILRKTAQGYIDTAVGLVKFPLDVAVATGKGIWGIAEFERDLMIDPERAQKTAATTGEYIGKALVAGVKLWAGGSEYANQINQSGDYRRPFQDLGNAINKWYDALTPGDQMHAMATISAGFGLSAAAGQLRQLAKPGAFVQFLEEAAQAVPKNPEAQAKAAESVKKLIQAFSRSNVGKLATAEGPAIDKADDMLNMEKRIYKSAETGQELSAAKAAEKSSLSREAFDKLSIKDQIKALAKKGWDLIVPKKYHIDGCKQPLSEAQMAKKLDVSKDKLRSMTVEELAKEGVTPIEPVNGANPRNWKLAGKTYDFAKKHPETYEVLRKQFPEFAEAIKDGIKFTKDGYPDLSPFRKAEYIFDHSFTTRTSDFLEADKSIWPHIKTAQEGNDLRAKYGLTWHHHQDGRTLQLVPTELHDKVKHTGGFAIEKTRKVSRK